MNPPVPILFAGLETEARIGFSMEDPPDLRA